MNTPITDDQARHVFQSYDNRGKYLPAGLMVDANLSRRLELNRAALMEALECALEWVPETATIMHEKAESALSAARANFPTP